MCYLSKNQLVAMPERLCQLVLIEHIILADLIRLWDKGRGRGPAPVAQIGQFSSPKRPNLFLLCNSLETVQLG